MMTIPGVKMMIHLGDIQQSSHISYHLNMANRAIYMHEYQLKRDNHARRLKDVQLNLVASPEVWNGS